MTAGLRRLAIGLALALAVPVTVAAPGAAQGSQDDQSEAVAAWKRFLNEAPQTRFAILDADGDGAVTRAEYRGLMRQIFAPDDGALAPNEEAILQSSFNLSDSDYSGDIDYTEYRAASMNRVSPVFQITPPLELDHPTEPLVRQNPPANLPPLDGPADPGEPRDRYNEDTEDIPRTDEDGGG